MKNISHVGFGRIGKRHDANSKSAIVTAVERLTKGTLSQAERSVLNHGADEFDLVDSGLEETMINAYNDLFETYASRKKVKELRTASFVLAIDRIAQSYMELGIFP